MENFWFPPHFHILTFSIYPLLKGTSAECLLSPVGLASEVCSCHLQYIIFMSYLRKLFGTGPNAPMIKGHNSLFIPQSGYFQLQLAVIVDFLKLFLLQILISRICYINDQILFGFHLDQNNIRSSMFNLSIDLYVEIPQYFRLDV